MPPTAPHPASLPPTPAGAAVGFSPETMRDGAAAAVRLLKMLANEDRLMLLCQLSQGEICVSDLEALLGIRQPTLSQQLAVLRTDGLVSTRRDGKNVFYAIARPDVLRLLQTLHELHCAAAAEKT